MDNDVELHNGKSPLKWSECAAAAKFRILDSQQRMSVLTDNKNIENGGLASLKDAGILTEEEFTTKKAELLAKM